MSVWVANTSTSPMLSSAMRAVRICEPLTFSGMGTVESPSKMSCRLSVRCESSSKLPVTLIVCSGKRKITSPTGGRSMLGSSESPVRCAASMLTIGSSRRFSGRPPLVKVTAS